MVARCRFLVASLFDVNDAAHSMAQAIRFDCLKISRTEVSINLEVNWLMTKAKQAKIKCLF